MRGLLHLDLVDRVVPLEHPMAVGTAEVEDVVRLLAEWSDVFAAWRRCRGMLPDPRAGHLGAK